MDSADLIDLQFLDAVDVAVHDPLEAVADPDDVDSFQAASDRRGADDAIDTGGRTAPNENG
jgi:hypothetical protein